MIVILKVLGTPSEEEIKFITDDKALEYLRSFPKTEKNDLFELFPAVDKEVIDFLEKTLTFNPFKRYSIDECL